MTREEQILNKAIDYSEMAENILEYDDCGDVCNDIIFVQQAFIEGAKWADRTMIDKVCDWLVENAKNYMMKGEERYWYDSVKLKHAIKKVMKGEE